MNLTSTSIEAIIHDLQQRIAPHYVIFREWQDELWFFHDLDTIVFPYKVFWTPYRSKAYQFPDKELAEEFKIDFLIPRKVGIMKVR